MGSKQKILIVEDELPIRAGLVNLFVFHGYEVVAACDGVEAVRLALNEKPDLMVLDIMLPLKDGFTVCQEVRRDRPRIPIIMLTARVSEEDIVHGLELGADDYMAKPFSVRELLLRAQSILRRTSPVRAAKIKLSSQILIETENFLGTGKNGEKTEFTFREIEILKYLLSENGRAKSRNELLVHVWGYTDNVDIDTRTVDIHIAKLRKKIEADPKDPQCLITVRGVGYRLTGEEISP